MKRSFLIMAIAAIIAVSCARVNPPVEDANASFNYGKSLMNDGKFALAVIEFKKAQEFYEKAGYTYSTFAVYPYIARGYYVSGNADEAIATYFTALSYAKDHSDAVSKKETADVMRELAGLLVEKKRIDEARYLLTDAAQLYKALEDMGDYNEVLLILNGL